MLAIYTPTYNRSKELSRLYESLCRQQNKNFFWLIIDDGSTDNTKEMAEIWIDELKIDVRYIYKENGGKHTAINVALENVDKYWNFCVDSDDWLINDFVIDKIYDDIIKIEKDQNIVSIVYPRDFNNLELKSTLKTYQIINDCRIDMKHLNVLETTIISRPGAYGNIRFPVFDNEKFITSYAIEITKLMSKKMIYAHYPIVEGKYLEEGLTSNIVSIWKDNPNGYYYVRNLEISYYLNNKSYTKCLRPIGQIIAYNIEMRKQMFFKVDNKFLGIISLPLGIGYWYRKFKK